MIRLGRLVLTTLIALASFQARAGEDQTARSPKLDPEVQSRIEQVVVAIVRGEENSAGRIEALRQLGGRDRRSLLLQLALYLEHSSGTEQSMAGALIVQHLAFTPEEKLQSVLPHLDGAGPGLRRVFTELLATIDRAEGGEPDYRFYETQILKGKDAPPPALIRYMYEVSPGAALASMERIYGGGPARKDAAARKLGDVQGLLARHDAGAPWSDPDLPRLRSVLESLSKDPGWWRRLYAAAILTRNPDLATAEMTRRLRSDLNTLVRDTVSP